MGVRSGGAECIPAPPDLHCTAKMRFSAMAVRPGGAECIPTPPDSNCTPEIQFSVMAVRPGGAECIPTPPDSNCTAEIRFSVMAVRSGGAECIPIAIYGKIVVLIVNQFAINGNSPNTDKNMKTMMYYDLPHLLLRKLSEQHCLPHIMDVLSKV